MIGGVPKEIKNHEYRDGLTPESVEELKMNGHDVVVETGASLGIGASDEQYAKAGARILNIAAEVFKTAKMIIKVKEQQPAERAMLRDDHVL